MSVGIIGDFGFEVGVIVDIFYKSDEFYLCFFWCFFLVGVEVVVEGVDDFI